MMKRTVICICMLCMSIGIFAQATDLVIDNQTPGWLSSKINYGDQMTVRNLKVTGFLNSTDITFIGSLIQNRNLHGRLDLSQVNMVGDPNSKTYSTDNVFDYGMFNITNRSELQYLSTPKSCNQAFCISDYLLIDTLIYDINTNYLSPISWPKTLILGENIDSIPNAKTEYTNRLESVYLSPKTKYIGNYAFSINRDNQSLKYINFNDLEELHYLGHFAFAYKLNVPEGYISMPYVGTCQPDTLFIPQTLTTLPSTAFVFKDGMHIFIGDNIEKIISYENTYNRVPVEFLSNGTYYFHMSAKTPPSGVAPGSNCIVRVPQGAVEAYKNSNWRNAIIQEEVLVSSIELNANSINIDQEQTVKMSILISPYDADNKKVIWTTSDDSIASVDKYGKITGINPGTTMLYVHSVATEACDSCIITVNQHVENISIDTRNVTFSKIGDSKKINVIFTPENTTDRRVKWTSSDTSICSVNENGELIAMGNGICSIVAMSNDRNKIAVCIVTVGNYNNNSQDVNQDGKIDTQDVIEIYEYMQKQ